MKLLEMSGLQVKPPGPLLQRVSTVLLLLLLLLSADLFWGMLASICCCCRCHCHEGDLHRLFCNSMHRFIISLLTTPIP